MGDGVCAEILGEVGLLRGLVVFPDGVLDMNLLDRARLVDFARWSAD